MERSRRLALPKPAESPARGDEAGETGWQLESAKAANVAAARQAAQRLAEQGESDEALQLLRSRIDAGDFIGAVLDFAVAVLSAKGRAEEAIDLCRRAALNPSADYDSATYATCRTADSSSKQAGPRKPSPG